MRVTIYDKNPGPGFNQWFLKTSWLVGCWLQKLFGKVDRYYGASNWAEALHWLSQQGPLESIQYWGHGSPGDVWLAGKALMRSSLGVLKPQLSPTSLLWFRTCSTFQGGAGYSFSMNLSTILGCTIAGHTRVIGLFQGGLHTRKPDSYPSWPLSEGEFPKSFWTSIGLKWGNHTVTCLATKIPEGW